MEHLWSQAGATGGNRSQMRQGRNRLKYADRQRVATHGNGSAAHGKEGVDGSSPSEGLQNPRSRGFFVQNNLLFVVRTVGMEPFMELSRTRVDLFRAKEEVGGRETPADVSEYASSVARKANASCKQLRDGQLCAAQGRRPRDRTLQE